MAMTLAVRTLVELSLKRCTKCERIKHLSDFQTERMGAGGVASKCKPCAKAARRAWLDGPAGEKQRENVRKWATANRDRKTATNKAWKLRNQERAREIERRSTRKRRATPEGKLKHRVSVNVRQCLLRQGRTKGGRTFDALGYSPAELLAHLERQFTKGMSWENMGEWHIDHIVPLASFELDSLESDAFKRAWSLPNLRPIWGTDNVRKHAKRMTLL